MLTAVLLTGVFTAGAAAEDETLRFSTVDIDGNSVDESIFEQSEITVFNFWEYWCNPCKAELPALMAASEIAAEYGVQIIGVVGSGIAETQEDELEGAAEKISELGLEYRNIVYTDEFKAIDRIDDGFVAARPMCILMRRAGLSR